MYMRKFLTPEQVRPLKKLSLLGKRVCINTFVRACAKKEIHLALDQNKMAQCVL